MGMRGRIETSGFLRGGTMGSNQEKMPKISPARAPTTGPSRAPPTMAGMCKIVARPETFGTGIKPSWVAPRKIAIPPSIPAMTICLTSSLKTEPPRPPPESAVMIFSFCRLLRPAILYTGRDIHVRGVGPLEGRREAAVRGGPATVDEHEGARYVGAGIRGEVEDHPDHLVRLGPAAEDALGRVGIVPVRGVFDLCREWCLDDAWSDSVDPYTARPDFGSKRPEHLHRTRLGRGIDALPRFHDLPPDARERDDAARAALGHAGSEVPDQAESPLQVELDDLVELIVCYLEQRLPDVDGRRAHQHVGNSHGLDRPPYAVLVRHIQLDSLGLTSLRAYLCGRILRGLTVYVGANHARPEGREPVRAGLADTAAGPDDERGLA